MQRRRAGIAGLPNRAMPGRRPSSAACTIKSWGVPLDDAQANKWYRKAAEPGNALGQVGLGLRYEMGLGVNKDYAEAARWFRKVAEQGDDNAQSQLGYLYEAGHGVPQDYVLAHMWLNLAAASGSGWSQKMSSDARDRLATKMTPEQIAEAQRQAREWKPKSAK